jgi:N-acetyl-gamma-glutamyl-phosphate reductase
MAGKFITKLFSSHIMTYRVFVDGQEGTTGLRIHEYLARRPDIEVLRIDPEKRKDPAERARLLNASDVAFLCLPDVSSVEAVTLVTNPKTCLIDASTAHRTHPQWTFGLPELTRGQRDRIEQSKRISNPGCHSTGFLLLARPLIDARLLARESKITATSITGYSGGGKKMIEQYEADQNAALLSPRPYALSLQHKHLPEMQKYANMQFAPVFLPVVGAFYQGLAVSIPLHLSQFEGKISADDIQQAYLQHYANEANVQVMPLSDTSALDNGFFDVQACNQTNRVDIFVFANESQVLLMARLDNLGKGASGAAVQSMNLHLGIQESLGLS